MEPQDRDMLIRIDENVKELRSDVSALDRILHGNGRPGMVVRLAELETAHTECKFQKEKPRSWPAVVAAVCALVAVAINIFKIGAE